MNKNILMWILGILLLTSFAFASDGCFTNENCTLWASLESGTSFYPANQTNVTILYPNGSTFIQDAEMIPALDNESNILPGRFYYIMVANVTGNYYSVATFYNSTGGVLDTADQSTEVISNENDETIMGLIIGNWIWIMVIALSLCGAVIAFILYLSKENNKLKEKSDKDEEKEEIPVQI